MKKTAIALAIALLKALNGIVWGVGRFVLLVIILPIQFIAGKLLRPLLLALYRQSFPIRLAIGKIIAPAKRRTFAPLTTRYVAHALIAVLTIVISTSSIAAQEVKTATNGHRSLLASLVTADSAETLTTIIPDETLTPAADVAALAKTDGAEVAEAEDGTDISALEKPLLTETTSAGQPRQEIVHYTVEGGDTVSTIAEKFGVSSRTLLWANGLSDRDFIKPGQALTVPPVSGVLHKVKSGETLQGIANKYKANVDSILEFNRLASAEAIESDQTLVVPGGEIEDAPAQVTRPRYAQFVPDYGATPPPSAPARGSGLLWPTPSRRINRGFLGYHPALDIDGNVGSPIYAADAGRVTTVKYERYGYGYHVIVSHGGGETTLYAHASKIFVKPGDSVQKGQTIALIGLTGRTSGAHLHFEVARNGRRVNPLGYLNR